MRPLQDLTTERVRDKQTVRWAAWTSQTLGLDFPGNGSDKAGRWQDGSRIRIALICGVDAGQGKRLDVVGAQVVGQVEIETSQKELPKELPSVMVDILNDEQLVNSSNQWPT